MAELHEMDAWVAALLAQLKPAVRKKMLREIVRDVCRIQQANITAQRSSDGTVFEPRRISARSKKGRIRWHVCEAENGKLPEVADGCRCRRGCLCAEGSEADSCSSLQPARPGVSRRGPVVKCAGRPPAWRGRRRGSTVRETLLQWLAE